MAGGAVVIEECVECVRCIRDGNRAGDVDQLSQKGFGGHINGHDRRVTL